MIYDKHLLLEEIAGILSTGNTTDALDFEDRLGSGSEVRGKMRFEILEDGAGAGTCEFQIQHSDNGVDYEVCSSYFPVAGAEMKNGDYYDIPLNTSHKRFVRGGWVVTGSITTGKVTCGIVAN